MLNNWRKESTWFSKQTSTNRSGNNTLPLRTIRDRLLQPLLQRSPRPHWFNKNWANSKLIFPRSVMIRHTCKLRRLNFQVSNSTSRFQHQKDTMRLESLLLVTLPCKATVQPLKSKFLLNHWTKGWVIRPMDRNRGFRAGHIYFTAYYRIIIKQLTTRWWTMEFRMPQLLQILSTSLSKTTADMKCSRNHCQTLFSFPSDPWTRISKTTVSANLLIPIPNL